MQEFTAEQLNNRLQLFYGDTSLGTARVYAQLDLDGLSQDFQLSGSLVGPSCMYAHTLPAHFRLVDAGPGQTLLAQAVINDPCLWSADMPYLYTATIELRCAGELLVSIEREFGLRLLVARGNRLEWSQQPYELRGRYRPEIAPLDLPQFHDDEVAVLTPSPNEEVCREASRVGVLLMAVVSGDEQHVVTELSRLSRWPAVGIIVIDATLPAGVNPRIAARNVLLAQLVNESDVPISVSDWAGVLLVRGEPGPTELSSSPKIDRDVPVLFWDGTSVTSTAR